MFGKREKYKVAATNFEEMLEAARSLYSNGRYVEAIDVYEQIADNFDTYSPHQSRLLVDILAEVYDCFEPIKALDRYSLYQGRFFDFDIQSTDKVLDIGSGDRPFPLATHLADIALYDDTYGRAGTPLRYFQGKPLFECNIESLPFDANEFDFVYCSHVLEHTIDPQKACSELMRVAKRGFIETPNRGKDLWLNYAKISNHRWAVELCNKETLVFTEYGVRDINGFYSDILNQMHEHPQTQREKAFSALVLLKADLVNTMLLWEDQFSFEIRRATERPTADTLDGPLVGGTLPMANSVAVVIPTYNRAELLKRAILSVQCQTHQVMEIIVVDDASTDDTASVVQELKRDDARITFIQHQRNLGAQAARNDGIKASSSQWIAFLDSDDEWLPKKLAIQLVLANEKKLSVVQSEGYMVRGDSGPHVPIGVGHYQGNAYAMTLSNPGPMFQGLLVRRECLQSIGLLDESVPSYQEWDTAIRLSKHYEFGFIEEPLFVYHCHSGETISKDKMREAKGHAYIVEKHEAEIDRVAGKSALLNHLQLLSAKFSNLGDSAKGAYYKRKMETIGIDDLIAQAVRLIENHVNQGRIGEARDALLQLSESVPCHQSILQIAEKLAECYKKKGMAEDASLILLCCGKKNV